MASDEGQTLEYVPETPIQVSDPHPSTHVVPGGNYSYTKTLFVEKRNSDYDRKIGLLLMGHNLTTIIVNITAKNHYSFSIVIC